MQSSKHYKLNKPEYTDKADIEALNENTDDIDLALHTLESRQSTHEQNSAAHVTAADKQNWNKHIADRQNPHGVSISQIGAAETKSINAQLSLSAWQGDLAPYTQTLSVSEILVSDNPIVGPILTDDVAQSEEILDSWSNVSRIKTEHGSLTALCYSDKPTVEIPIQIKVVR